MDDQRFGLATRHVWPRRHALRIGGLSALGFQFGLGDFVRYQRLQAGEAPRGRARACILIWLDGGPSHLETWDPKPDAPAEVRGPLGTIGTSLSGVRIGECLPQTAKLLEHVALVRSLTSPLGEHNFGTHYLLTGYQPTPALEYPTFGAVLANVHAHRQDGAEPPPLPPYVSVPNFSVGGNRLSGYGYLSSAVAPFAVGGDPAKPNFQVRDLDLYRGLDLSRLQRRKEFVSVLERFADTATASSGDSDLERAYRLLSSPAAKQAFDLSLEPAAVRQRYGGKTVGQSCLLARRLVEAGVPFVTVNHQGWDTHNDLVTRLKDGFTGAKVGVGLIPALDLALSALLTDLHERQMLQETLVVVMGEFGRTPKLNALGGRDHWPRVFSMLLAGGGVPGGQVLGSSDATGESPYERPITPSDVSATLFTLLGVDPTMELHTRDGRPVRIVPTAAQAIPELIS